MITDFLRKIVGKENIETVATLKPLAQEWLLAELNHTSSVADSATQPATQSNETSQSKQAQTPSQNIEQWLLEMFTNNWLNFIILTTIQTPHTNEMKLNDHALSMAPIPTNVQDTWEITIAVIFNTVTTYQPGMEVPFFQTFATNLRTHLQTTNEPLCLTDRFHLKLVNEELTVTARK